MTNEQMRRLEDEVLSLIKKVYPNGNFRRGSPVKFSAIKETGNTIVSELKDRCGIGEIFANVDGQDDTCFRITLSPQSGEINTGLAKKTIRILKQLGGKRYLLGLMLSALGPYAYLAWGEQRINPDDNTLIMVQHYSNPPSQECADIQRCVDETLKRHGIKLLGRDLAEKIVPWMSTEGSIVQDLHPTVYNCLFVQY